MSLNKSNDHEAAKSLTKTLPTDLTQDHSLAETQLSVDLRDISHESVLTFFLQSLPPLMFASIGLIGTSVLFGAWENGLFYNKIHEGIMLTPPLLGLKGNIEMTYASRLATLAHFGKMDDFSNCLTIFGSNMALVQTQAIIVSLFAAMITIVSESVRCNFHFGDSHILAASAVGAASLSSVVLCSVIIGMVMLARKVRINPDNVMSPLASSLGDLITFLIFVGMGTLQVWLCSNETCWLSIVILSLALCIFPVVLWFAYKNIYTRPTLKWGWFSIAFAAIVSSGGGWMLERYVLRYRNLAKLQPLMSGLAGNRAAVQCSRLSTSFHISNEKLGVVEKDDTFLKRLNPWNCFKGKDIHSKTAWVLITCAVPLHWLFMSIIILLSESNTSQLFNWQFFTTYSVAALIQIFVLMYLSQLLVYLLWRLGADPDHSAIPIVTSISDLIGIALLVGVFTILEKTSQNPYSTIGCVNINDHVTSECFAFNANITCMSNNTI